MPNDTDFALSLRTATEIASALDLQPSESLLALILDRLEKFRNAVLAPLAARIADLERTVVQQKHLLDQLHQLVDTLIVHREPPPNPA